MPFLWEPEQLLQFAVPELRGGLGINDVMTLLQLIFNMNRGALFHLPFLQDYNPLYRSFLPVSRTEVFLRASFYPRLNNIYINLLDAISKKNYRYLSANLEASLAAQLLSEMKALDESRLKIRVQSPVVRTAVQRKKKFEKWTGFRERVWSNGVTQIGVQCCVYFGRKFD